MSNTQKGLTSSDTAVLRYSSNGALDPGFGAGGVVRTPVSTNYSDCAYAAVNYPANRILMAGWARTNPTGGSGFTLARYNANGDLDTTFGGEGKKNSGIWTSAPSVDGCFTGVVVEPDGSILAAGYSGGGALTLAHYTPSGALDTHFGTNGFVIWPKQAPNTIWLDTMFANQMVAMHQGKIVVCGTWSTPREFVVAQYNLNGSLDTTFGQDLNGDGKLDGLTLTDFGGVAEPETLAVGKDNSIVLFGYAPSDNGVYGFGLARYSPTGQLLWKTTADFSGLGEMPLAMAIDPVTDKIVAVGVNGYWGNSFVVARFNPDGTLDTTFGQNGLVVQPLGANVHVHARSVLIQANPDGVSDGKIVVTGCDEIASNAYAVALARFNGDGSLDTTFGSTSPAIAIAMSAAVAETGSAQSADPTLSPLAASLPRWATLPREMPAVAQPRPALPQQSSNLASPRPSALRAASSALAAEAADRVMAELSVHGLKVSTPLPDVIAES